MSNDHWAPENGSSMPSGNRRKKTNASGYVERKVALPGNTLEWKRDSKSKRR